MPIDTTTPPTEFPFPWPNADKGYDLFDKELEEDDLVAFHGTSKEAFDCIRTEGLKKSQPPLESVSFARKSKDALGYACDKRSPGGQGVVVAVKFETLAIPEIAAEISHIHVYRGFQPKIIGYCIVPSTYEHR